MKIKHIDIKWLFFAMLITFFLAYIIPCSQINDWQKVFGFPFAWFTVYHNEIGNSIMSSTHVNLLLYLADVAICYLLVLVIEKFYKKSKDKNNQILK